MSASRPGEGSAPARRPGDVSRGPSSRSSHHSHSSENPLSAPPTQSHSVHNPESPSVTVTTAPSHSRVGALSRSDCIDERSSSSHRYLTDPSPSVHSSHRVFIQPSSESLRAIKDNFERRRLVRTLPPWVENAGSDEPGSDSDSDMHIDSDDDHAGDGRYASSSRLAILPASPTAPAPSVLALHNHAPAPRPAVPGRQFDHRREKLPVMATVPVSSVASHWRSFASTSSFPQRKPPFRPISHQPVQSPTEKDYKPWGVGLPDMEKPEAHELLSDQESDSWIPSPAQRARFYQRLGHSLMRKAIVPLIIRSIVLTFSVAALALSASILRMARIANCDSGSSTYMALIVDACAIVYTFVIAHDEYLSKPLGLRSARSKMRLLFFDLFFIVFESANIALAFSSLVDEQWACHNGLAEYRNDDDSSDGRVRGPGEKCRFDSAICTRQRALTAVLMITLVAWITTFAISTLRVITRASAT